MKFERAYKKQNERKGFLQIFSPFEVEGWKDSYIARIELELHQEKGHLPTAYLLNVSIEKQPLFLGRRDAGAEPFDRTEADRIRTDFPEIVKSESVEEDKKPSGDDATLSVVGPSAKTWDKLEGRAFRGRDDGKLRVELDALNKVKDLLQQKRLVYSKHTAAELEDLINKQATPPTDNASVFFQSALVRSAV